MDLFEAVSIYTGGNQFDDSEMHVCTRNLNNKQKLAC